ncbi:hypothetical protein [Solitalea canadensis]|uniref:Uncharacterized protein n=1 Tax=Solitalea canadensis (strain ATCC 29591 / DSM 3403 / JCM 21819 / LMG 8368 / NBRC 15130 / NCIMB 12057 / USAM 9D) TaxID=929556 RepID=H8KR48_SOLCM|nr:hypothetical protein [Solitalea canadensis]AFD07254.1 hypothetical protein Solca_2209 [Solitalea canadensis DSM 3403]
MGNTTAKNITPELAVQILKKYGTEITIEEAKLVLHILNKLANLAINQISIYENG